MKNLTSVVVTRSALICLLALFSANSHALGLGDIEVTSSLNHPLKATVELTGAVDLSAADLVVKLAGEEAFERMGIPRGHNLTQLEFSPDLTASPPHIVISSRSSLREPLLVFVLDVQWPNGQILREYRAFLSPAPER